MAQSVTLTVIGMKCGGCEQNLIEKLTTLKGLIHANADHKEKSVCVEFDDSIIDIDEIEECIIAAGFTIE